MKKRFLSFILIIPLLCGCSFFDWKWSKHTTINSSYNYISKKLQNVNLNFDYEKLESAKTKLSNDVLNNSDISNVKKSFINFSFLVKELSEKETYLTTYYYISPSKYSENYEKFLNAMQDTTTFYTSLLNQAAKSSNDIKEFFFETTDQKVIDQKIAESEKNKELAIIENQMTKISDSYSEFYSLNMENRSLLFEEAIEKYPEYVALANEYAKLNNYDNYLDYAYKEIYSRDYSPKQGLEFAKNFKVAFKNIDLSNKSTTLEYEDSLDFSNAKKIKEQVFNKTGNPASGLMDSYADFMGRLYKKTYNHLWRNGYYCFSSSEDSLGTAFVSCEPSLPDQVVFYSAANQDVSSVLHEFGHYFALTNNKNAFNYSYDILETHSQANEFLFLNYLKNNYNNKFMKQLGDIKIIDNIAYLANFAYIIEVENFAFHEKTLTKEELKDYVLSLNEEYTNLGLKYSPYYWMYPCICSSCYYISYGTSSLEAMQFNTMDLNKAKNTYIEFCLDSSDTSAEEKWTNSGLTSPFDKQAFQNLANYVMEI